MPEVAQHKVRPGGATPKRPGEVQMDRGCLGAVQGLDRPGPSPLEAEVEALSMKVSAVGLPEGSGKMTKRTTERRTEKSLTRRQLLNSGFGLLGAAGLIAGGVATAPPAMAAGAGWVPVQFRSVDTRSWGYKPVRGDVFEWLDLTNDMWGNWIIQAPAVAVSYNLTATQTEGIGYLSLWRMGDSWPGTSSINWTQSGLDIANGGIVGLGYSYYASLLLDSSLPAKAHFVIDVTGYFSP